MKRLLPVLLATALGAAYGFFTERAVAPNAAAAQTIASAAPSAAPSASTMPMKGGMPMNGMMSNPMPMGTGMSTHGGMQNGMPMQQCMQAQQSRMQLMHSAADRTMMQAMIGMQRSTMTMTMTGNADRDFIAMMIPHHQAAVAMAKAELRYGKDRRALALAKSIVSTQQKEIDEMEGWRL